MSNFNVLLITIALISICILCLYYFLSDPDHQRNQRKRQFVGKTIDSTGNRMFDSLQAKKKKELYGEPENKRKKAILSGGDKSKTLNFKIEQAGLSINPIAYRAIFAIIGLIVGNISLLLLGNFYISIGIGALVAIFAPIMFINKKIDQCQRKFTELLPQALDVFVRGIKSGLPVADCIRIVSTEIEDPIGKEFKIFHEQLSIGVSMEEALNKFYTRMPIKELNFLRIVLVIQRQTGGNLSEIMSNLANMIRGRKKLKSKVKSLSAEAKTGAIIIGSLPVAVMGMIYMINPDYILVLFTDSRGTTALGGVSIWMGLGVIVMRKMMDFKV